MKEKPFMVGVCGGSGSGKTSVANIIFKSFGEENCLLFSMDMYYKGPTPEERKHLSDYNFDHPNALDLDLLSKHLSMLMNGESIDMPIYSFNGSYRTKDTTKVRPKRLIIFEGILAFYDKRMRDLMDMKVFVDLDSDIRLARRCYRDIKDRGRGLDTIIERYHKFVKPAFSLFIEPTKKYADIIIPRGAENTQAVDLVRLHLKSLLLKHFKDSFPEGTLQGSIKKIIPIELSDIFDAKKEFEDCLILPSKEKRLKILRKIFYDFINWNHTAYFVAYHTIILKKLLKLISANMPKGTQYYMISEVKPGFAVRGKSNVLFVPALVKISEGFKKFLSSVNPSTSLTLAAVTLTEKVLKEIRSINPKIKFIAIYYGPATETHKQYILTGGFAGQGEAGANIYLCPFSTTVFEREFIMIKSRL